MVKGHCFKCREAREILNPKFELNKVGRPTAHGACAKCGGSVYKILSAAETPADLKAKAEKFKAAKRGGTTRSSKRASARKPAASRGSNRGSRAKK